MEANVGSSTDGITYAGTYPQYAFNGSPVQLSGYVIFVKWNLIRLAVGLPISVTLSMTDVNFVSLNPTMNANADLNPTTMDLNLGDTGGDANSSWGVFVSPPCSPGRYFHPNTLRWLTYRDAGDGSGYITNAYLNAFGFLAGAYHYVFVKAVPFSPVAPKFAAPKYYRVYIDLGE
jgi:hypothetical protein